MKLLISYILVDLLQTRCKRQFFHKNYSGSCDAISDDNGRIVERLNFDPCSVTPGFGELANPNPLVELIPAGVQIREGRRRNPDTGVVDDDITSMFDRGYTVHQHLDDFKLINMNGRVYDPVIARFLSPDPFIQSPGYGQNYNRYTYCLNNPLKYTDPSGYNHYPLESYAQLGGGGEGFLPTTDFGTNPNSGQGDSGNHSGGSYYYHNGNYYNASNGNSASYQEVYANYIAPYSLRVTWLYFAGPKDDPYRQVTGATFDDGRTTWLYADNWGTSGSTPGATDGVMTEGCSDLYDLANLYFNGVNVLAYTINTRQITDLGQLDALGPYFLSRVNTASKWLTRIGTSTSIVGGSLSIFRYSMIENPTWGDKTELGIGITSSVLSAIPYTTYLGIGIGIVDVSGGFGGLYDYMNMNEQLFNNSGFILIPPINGVITPIKF